MASWFCSLRTCHVETFAVGASQYSRFKPVTVIRKTAAVTMIDIRQAVSAENARVNRGIERLRSHQDLRDATSQISQYSCCDVDNDDHVGRQPQGTPELADVQILFCCRVEREMLNIRSAEFRAMAQMPTY